MRDSNGKENIFSSFHFITFYLYLALSIVTLIYSGITYLVQDNDNDHGIKRYERNQAYNLFVDSVAQGENLLPLETPAYRLYNDLNTFLDAEKIESPFQPGSLEEVNVAPGTYSGLHSQVGCILKEDLSLDQCHSHGYFTSDFILMYRAASLSEDPSVYYKSVIEQDTGIYIYPFSIAWYEYYLGLLLVSNLMTTLVYFLRTPGYRESKFLSAKGIPFILGIFFLFPLYFFALKEDYSHKKEKKKDQRRLEQEEKDRLVNHPLSGELFSLQDKLKTLQELNRQYPTDAKIKAALKACQEVITELETFPIKYSQKTAQYLALEIQKDLTSTKELMADRLEAIDEINNL